MRPDQLETLRQQRDKVAAAVQALHDTPESERPSEPKKLKAWLRELESAEEMLAQMDSMLSRADRAAARAEKASQPRPAPKPSEDVDAVLVARIHKSHDREIRVTVQTWRGNRTVDIRSWFTAADGEKRPTTKGIQMDVKRLPALIDALRSASQHA